MGLRHFALQPLWKLVLTPLFLAGLRVDFALCLLLIIALALFYIVVMAVFMESGTLWASRAAIKQQQLHFMRTIFLSYVYISCHILPMVFIEGSLFRNNAGSRDMTCSDCTSFGRRLGFGHLHALDFLYTAIWLWSRVVDSCFESTLMGLLFPWVFLTPRQGRGSHTGPPDALGPFACGV